jgi:hypothetical protein
MTTHKIRWLRTGSYNGMDWEAEHEITFRFRPGRPAKMYLRNGDPGYPADPDEVEFVSITPDAGDHGAFSDIAQRNLESDAQEWLETDGFDEAIQIATSDLDAAREFAADLRADR